MYFIGERVYRALGKRYREVVGSVNFHYYCRRIVHWNLPSNPIDIEQRGDPNESIVNNTVTSNAEPVSMLMVTDESLKMSGTINGKKYPMQYVIQSDATQNRFRPKHKVKYVYGENEKVLKALELPSIISAPLI